MPLDRLGGDRVPEPIASSDELDAELERLARTGGTPADFDVALHELAPRLERALDHRALIRVARLGWTAYNGLADVPGDELPVFLGRPWADLPEVPRRRDPDSGPRREPLPDESLPEYVGALGESLFTALGLGDDDAATPFGRAAGGYLSLLAVPGLRELVGWERSLDAHALAMLTAERALRHLGEVGMSAAEEEACFRWLHLATYDEVLPEHLEEMSARRAIRLAHGRQPPGAVAVMTCEVSVTDALWFQERISGMPSAAMSAEQLRSMLDHLALHAKNPARWTIRRQGFGQTGRIDLTATAAERGPDYGAFVQGHVIRWMVDQDVPFRPHMFGCTGAYAASVHRSLVERPAKDGRDCRPIVAHLRAMRLVREEGLVTLADELVLLAWLMDQRSFGIRLSAYLDARSKLLAGKPGA
jgi:hypothetical protein